MKKEHKDILLKDLCARLPYGVIIEHEGNLSTLDTFFMCDFISISSTSIDKELFYNLDLDEFKPYLFPLSSMTDEQRKEYEWIIYRNIELHCERYYNVIDIDDFDCLMDFYHKNHLDYRGLIPMGLAIDATNLNIY